MWRSKKFILIAVLSAVVLVGSIGGVVFAQTENGDDSQPEARHEAMLDRVCEIYEANTGTAIDSQALSDAFAEARSEMQTERMDSRLQKAVEEGRITQEQADQYKEWCQLKPDVPFKLGFGGRGGHRMGGGPHPMPW